MLAFWIAPLLAAAALATEAPAPGALSLAPLLEKVRQDNPDLLALDEERAAALDRAVAAGAFPDPSLGFAVRNLPVPSLSFREDMMTMKEVMVRQPFPWFGKRGLRREAVEKDAALAEAEKAARELALVEAAVGAYANLWLASASEAVVEAQRRDLARFAAIARGRYAAGGGSQADLLRADMELARIEEPLLELEEARGAARAALAALARMDWAALDGTPAPPPMPELPADPVPLLARIDAHPELRALEAQAERSEIEARAALRDRWPDPEIGLAYGQRDGLDDMIGAEVMFRIPVFAGAREERLAAAARAEARAARARHEALRERLVGEARAAWAAASRQRALVRLYDEEIVPRAARNLESAIGAYQAGAVDFLTLLDARVQLQGQQLEALRARANYVRQLARLARATGVPLFDDPAATEVHDG